MITGDDADGHEEDFGTPCATRLLLDCCSFATMAVRAWARVCVRVMRACAYV